MSGTRQATERKTTTREKKRAPRWGCASVDVCIMLDGKAVDPVLFDAIARERCGDFDELRNAVSVVVRRYVIHLNDEEAAREYACFRDFTYALHSLRVDSLIIYDGERIFSLFDWAIHDDAREFRRVTKKDQRDENGHYTKVTGNAFSELSGSLGQRYSFDIWTQERDERGREVTRGTHFYAFSNVMSGGIAKTAAAFAVDSTGTEATTLLYIIRNFNTLCERVFGRVYMDGGKPIAATVGGLAKMDLFAEMYGKETPRGNERAFKKEHAKFLTTGGYLRVRKFLRGGICSANPDIWGKLLTDDERGRRLKKYDVNSEYTRVAYDLGVPCDVYAVDARELNERRENVRYIIITDFLRMERREGMPPVFVNPFTAKQTDAVTIRQEFAIEAEELDELRYYYRIKDCEICYVFAVEMAKNAGVERYARKWYQRKDAAKKSGNGGLLLLAKLMNNSAWGQIAKKAVFPEVTHEYDKGADAFRLRERWTDEDAEKAQNDCGKYNLLWGGLITSGARVYMMRLIRKICGDKNALTSYVYGDTDSIHAYADAPAEIVGTACGQLKLELTAEQSKYIAKKVYYNAKTAKPLDIELHGRGVSVSEIAETLLDNYGTDSVTELPAEAFAAAFSVGMAYPTRALLQVRGGRVDMYVKKMLSADNVGIVTNSRGSMFVIDEIGNLSEL